MDFMTLINQKNYYSYNDIGKLIEIQKDCPKCKNNKSISFYNIPCSFDIENTSTYYNEEKVSFMYVWQFGINGHCFLGRTWEEFQVFCNYVNLIFDTYRHKLIIYCHNLSHEFQFMRKWLNWEEIFSIKKRTPLIARTVDGLEFRCSYLLTNKSLKKVGEDLKKYKINKLVGQLDYTKIRHNNTILTDDEIQYCLNDIKVVMAHIQEQIENEKYIHKIPLTQTGYVRRYVRKKCFNKNKYTNWEYKNLMKNLIINDLKEYNMLKSAFAGGFTHANAFNSNKEHTNVISYDICSSYPTMMIAYDYPMSKGTFIKIQNMNHLKECLKYYCCIFTIKFINIRSKDNILHENYLQYSKCHKCSKFTINNGRIVNAEEIIITITNIDYWIINQCYNYDNFQISDFIIYEKFKLPKEIIESILNFYNDKTSLKGVEDREDDYMRAKEMLNSIYGMCVTDIIREPIEYNVDLNKWCDEGDNFL